MDTIFAAKFQLGARHSANFKNLLSALVPHVLPAACPARVADLHSMKDQEDGGTP